MLKINDKVQIAENYHWAKNATGTILNPPNYILEISEEWDGISRKIKTPKGKLVFYWVIFDEPQFDSDGDGPYAEAEIDSQYLKLIHNKN